MGLAAARLLGPGGPYELVSAKTSHQPNVGVQVTCQPRQRIDPSFADATPWQLVLEDSRGEYESPPLISTTRKRKTTTKSRGSDMTFVDIATWLLSTAGQSFDTFQYSQATPLTSALILQKLAQRAQTFPGGPTWPGISIGGMPTFPVLLEDVKQSKLLDALRRLTAAAACEWVPTQSGGIAIHSIMQSNGSLTDFVPDSIEDSVNGHLRYTGLRVEKTSPIQSQVCFNIETTEYQYVQFPVPLTGVGYTDVTSGGYIDLVGVWAGDPRSGGKLIRFWSQLAADVISVPASGVGAATHATFVLVPSPDAIATGAPTFSRICFHGTPDPPPPSGIDLAFGQYFGSTVRPFPGAWNEPLIPSLAFATANYQGYLRQRNKGVQPVVASGRSCLHVDLAMSLVLNGVPTSRIEQFSHDFSLSSVKTSIQGSVYV